MLKQFAVTDLQVGMMVVRVIKQSGPVKIRKIGMVRSVDMINGLREMGVELVEVDLAQSIATVDDTEAPSTPIANDTATQKLMASDKQIADVDRQLSQQFHRSLFLPAIEQMPSKWTLYGKPYALLVLVILLGFGIGGGISVGGLSLYSQSQTDQNIVKNGQSTTEPPQAAPVQQQAAQVNTPQSDTSNELQTTSVTSTNEVADNASAENQSIYIASQNTSVNQTNSANNRQPSSSQPTQAAQPIIEDNVNGVPLEAGQLVLGYNGKDSEQIQSKPQTDASETPSEVVLNQQEQDPPINTELLKRVQQIANEVDGEETPANAVEVRDLNDLPRIDQLSDNILRQLPSMSFSAHMYASSPQDRWVRVNGRRLGEGDSITSNLQIESIEQEKVVLSFRGEQFTMNALSDW